MKGIKTSDILQLAASILVCQFSGLVGSYFTYPSISGWYAYLNKPSFTPPSWLFAPVWITLYTVMGISAFLVWRERKRDERAKRGLAIFAVQLALNALWSVVFFGFRSPISGLAVIGLLWLTILLTIWEFLKVSRTAGLLLLPYVLWVSFAAILNYSIFAMNP